MGLVRVRLSCAVWLVFRAGQAGSNSKHHGGPVRPYKANGSGSDIHQTSHIPHPPSKQIAHSTDLVRWRSGVNVPCFYPDRHLDWRPQAPSIIPPDLGSSTQFPFGVCAWRIVIARFLHCRIRSLILTGAVRKILGLACLVTGPKSARAPLD